MDANEERNLNKTLMKIRHQLQIIAFLDEKGHLNQKDRRLH
jgi:hypothetical protein